MKKFVYFKQSLSKGLQMNAKALLVLLLIMVPLAGSIYAQTIPSISWIQQFGTSNAEDCRGVWATGNIYLAGYTFGVFPGQTSDGTTADGFLVKYDPYGNSQWTSQYGSGGSESAFKVTADHYYVYTAGTTTGTFPGQTYYGAIDFYVRKCDHNGNVLWTRQYGSSANELQPELAVDATGVYVACQTGGTPETLSRPRKQHEKSPEVVHRPLSRRSHRPHFLRRGPGRQE